MPELSSLSDFITIVGIPGACIAALFYQNWQTEKRYAEQLAEERNRHSAESSAWVKALDNNTAALSAIREELSALRVLAGKDEQE